jgi:ribosomal protein S18 acetylase RimI-like enzyme
MLKIRVARREDADFVWNIIGPVIRAGETYTLPREMSREEALDYWFSTEHEVFVAEDPEEAGGVILGTYYMRANQRGGGAHVANSGYMTATVSAGKGVARAMCEHSLAHARRRAFRAMQVNFVVSTNERAVKLWQSFGFEIVGRLPAAFQHPILGYVDAFVMYRLL